MGMSMCTLGMAEELRPEGIGVNSLWPFTTIDTAAVRNALTGQAKSASRAPEIMAPTVTPTALSLGRRHLCVRGHRNTGAYRDPR